MSVTDIEQAVSQLAPEDLAVFRAWFAEFDADAWDQRIAEDAMSGRLDRFADEALTDLKEGRCTDL